MITRHPLIALALQSIVLALVVTSDVTADDEPVRLTLRGTVVLSDGSPVPGAVVTFSDQWQPTSSALADASGAFAHTGVFGQFVRLHTMSPGRTHQAVLAVPNLLARRLTQQPLRVVLEPAREIRVSVTCSGQPVDECLVAAEGFVRGTSVRTDPNGQAALLVPAKSTVERIVAFHDRLGVGAWDVRVDKADGSSDAVVEIRLGERQRQTIRVTDQRGTLVVDCEIGVSVGTKEDRWINGTEFTEMHVRTGANGEANVDWCPEGVKYLDVDLADRRLVVDSIDNPVTPEQAWGVHVRRSVAVRGKVQFPNGATEGGVLISGHSFGPGDRGDLVAVRTNATGEFTFYAAPDHAYVLGIRDHVWASSIWSGVPVRSAGDGYKLSVDGLTVEAEAATPIRARVVNDPITAPVSGAFVHLETQKDFNWTDKQGDRQYCGGSLRHWMLTDAKGEVEFAVGRGKHIVQAHVGSWRETRTLEVIDQKPLDVAFRHLVEPRVVRGTLLPLVSSPINDWTGATVIALAEDEATHGTAHAVVSEDGRFTVEITSKKIGIFAVTANRSHSGWVEVQPQQSSVSVTMQPMAEYAGTLFDAQSKPIGNQKLRLAPQRHRELDPLTATTDDQGRFRFPAVASGIPLQLFLDSEQHDSPYRFYGSHYFWPGERRAGTALKATPRSPPSRNTPVALPLQERLASDVRDARLAGMHVLLVIHSDDTDTIKFVSSQLLEDIEVPEILSYVPLLISSTATSKDSSAADFAQEQSWKLPVPKGILLAAVDGNGQVLGTFTLQGDKAGGDAEAARAFVARHQPPPRDTAESFATALEEAAASSRNVLIQGSGPRCVPCVGLSRWIEGHKGLLERDYVILKVDVVRDRNGKALAQRLVPRINGIPWMAIVDAKGMLLADSEGPLGNVGFPSEFEDLRHFRAMLAATRRSLTAEEIAMLIESLDSQ